MFQKLPLLVIIGQSIILYILDQNRPNLDQLRIQCKIQKLSKRKNLMKRRYIVAFKCVLALLYPLFGKGFKLTKLNFN